MGYYVKNGRNCYTIRIPAEPEKWRLKCILGKGEVFYEDLPPGVKPGGILTKMRPIKFDVGFKMYFVAKNKASQERKYL